MSRTGYIPPGTFPSASFRYHHHLISSPSPQLYIEHILRSIPNYQIRMAGLTEPVYFKRARQNGHIVVSGDMISPLARLELLTLDLDPPKFDLDAYIANYKGEY